jgi:matrix metalloproteinase-14 (membrane-inserted)
VDDLTYKITKYPKGLSKKEVDETVAKAFKVWEDATDLTFTKKNGGNVHIEIKFESGCHNDEDCFDGEGGTLAHAFFPMFGGDIHIDDDENWTTNSTRGTSLLMTVAHEIGHSLGLGHSNVRSSLMAPFYRGHDPDLKLQPDDVRGIQALYGKKTGPSSNEVASRRALPATPAPSTRRPAVTKEEDNSALCSRGHLDTIVTLSTRVTYAFLGGLYWRLTETSVEPGYPRSISADWDGLPGSLDASFTWTNGKTYFFKGSKYWRFSGVGQMDRGYPKKIREGFSGIPSNIDAAFVWPVNDNIYFFKGSRYWRFDPDSSTPVAFSYPQPVSNWDGIPNNLDSALQYSNGRTYFFKDGRYYRFNDQKGRLDVSANPPFPRETDFWWFGCPASAPLTRSINNRAKDFRWVDITIYFT